MWSQAIEKEAREASISKGTLKRAKAVLRVRSKKEADGCWSWQLPESKGIKGGQEAQEDQVRGDERLVPDGNGHHPSEHCIHDVLGGCWLCKRKHAHEEAQSGRLELEF